MAKGKKGEKSERNKLFHWHSSHSQPGAFMRSNVFVVFSFHLYSSVGWVNAKIGWDHDVTMQNVGRPTKKHTTLI